MKTQDLTTEIAARSAVNGILGQFNRLPDPDPILKKLGKDISVYNDLRSDSHMFSVEQQRKSGVLSLDWQLKRVDAVDNVYNTVFDVLTNKLDVYNLTDQILDCVLFGYSVFEIIWQKTGNLVLPERVDEKPREWFFYDNNNTLKMLSRITGASLQQGIELPAYKFIVPRHKPKYANPYGEKTISRCFWPIAFKRGGIKFWVTFTEKYGMPFLLGKLPRGLDKDKYTEMRDMLEAMIQDAVAAIPDDSSVEVKEFARQSSVDAYERLLYFMNSEISKAILTQTMTTEVQDKATHAASSTQSDMLTRLLKSDKRIVHNFFKQLIGWICEINFGDTERPVFEFYEDEDVDKTLSERDEILTRTGIKFTKDYYIKNYNLEEDDFELTTAAGPEFAAPPSPLQGEGLGVRLPDKVLQMQIEQTLKPVLQLIKDASTFEEINLKLAEIYPDMNTTQLESLLQKVLFYAEIEGRSSE